MPAAATSMTNSLEIQLTEPVIFLRMLERQQRRNVPIDNHREGSSPGALVRGVLTLTLAKAEKISSINVKLEGHAATNWIEGAGPSRIERSERYTVYSSSTVLFKAAPGSLRRGNQARRATSVLPLQRTYAIGYLDGARPFDTDFQSTQHSGNGRPELPLARHGNGNTTPLRMDGDSSTISAPESSYRGRRRSWHDSVEIELVKRDKQSDTRIFSDGVQSSVGENHTEPTPPYAPPPYPASQLDAGIPYLCPTEEEGGQEGEQGGSSIARDSTQIVLGSVSEDTTNSTSRSNSPEHHDSRGRSPGRISLENVVSILDAIKEHAARSLSPLSRRGLSVSRTRTVDSDQSCRGRSYSSKGKSKVVDPPSPNVAPNGSTVAGDVDVCDTCKRGNGEEWVSFQEGKYNYPIVFALPPDAPPTAIAEHGSFTWRLEAEVKQPGSRRKPTRMMTVYRDVEVVGAPADDQLDEHPESAVGILLQRTWESNFDYRLDIPRRNVPLSGTLPFQLTIMPLLKVRIYQILVQLDECVEYFSRAGTSVRTQTVRRATLFQLQHGIHTCSLEESRPILPLASSDVQTLRSSPLHRLIHADEDEREAASSYAGPGPWIVRSDLSFPGALQGFHASTPHVNGTNATHLNLKSNVRFNHMLRVTLRVEKEEGEKVSQRRQPGKKKRNLYDILVHAPVRMLSSICTAEWTTLPRYSCSSSDAGESKATPNNSFTSNIGSRSKFQPSQALFPGANNSNFTYVQADEASHSYASNGCHRGVHASCGTLYERLVSGLESETGEAPPGYSDNEF